MANLSPVRQALAEQFLATLQKGQLPWTACWKQQRPCNAITKKPYRGVNSMMLNWIASTNQWTDPRWCTYLQAQQKGWQVRKGSRGVKVEYWAYWDKLQNKGIPMAEGIRLVRKDPAYEKNLRLYAKSSTVFNGCQIDGIPPMEQGSTNIDAIRRQRDTLIANMGVGYEEAGDQPYYSPKEDKVVLPPEQSFDDVYSYLCTFLHECGHASGHESRLNRDLSGGFGSESYAVEELRVEIASAFAAQQIGLQLSEAQLAAHLMQHLAYVQSWAQAVQDALFKAIKAADEISDYLLENGEFLPMEQPEPIVQQQAQQAAASRAAVLEMEQP